MSSPSNPSPLIEALVTNHDYFHVRHYRHLGIAATGHAATRVQELGGCSSVIVLADEDSPSAAAGLRRHEFESDVLGRPVWRSTPLYTAQGPDRHDLARSLCRALLDRSNASDPAVVILRVDSDDVMALAAAQSAGFVVYDAGTVWVTTPSPDVDVPIPDGCEVRVLDASEAAALPDLAIDPIVDAARTRFRNSHFHTDPALDDRRADELYRRWALNTFRGGWSDHVITVTSDALVVGFLGFAVRRFRTSEGTIEVATDSFGLALEDAPPGVGTAMFRTAAKQLTTDVVEYGTQLRSELVPMFARSGLFRSVSSYYTLHGWCR